jgi:hypothetical protein
MQSANGYVTCMEGTKNISCLNLMAGTSYGQKKKKKKSDWQMSRAWRRDKKKFVVSI